MQASPFPALQVCADANADHAPAWRACGRDTGKRGRLSPRWPPGRGSGIMAAPHRRAAAAWIPSPQCAASAAWSSWAVSPAPPTIWRCPPPA
ncbi:hypothetical protein [Lysobacter gummosus]|uniref:hypothetical protein n=1 Tax=Lysobacter gummosus TaxID=262324 RepID=UPI00363A4951